MKEYKKIVDGQHAPEALILNTLNKIHEEEAKEQQHENYKAEKFEGATDFSKEKKVNQQINKRTIRKWIPVVAGMAAGLVLLVGVMTNQNSMKLNYNIVSDNSIRAFVEEQSTDNMEVSEYSAYLGVDVTQLIKNATLIKSEIHVIYEEDKTTVKDEEGTFYYNADGNQVMIKVSAVKEVAPEELLSGEVSTIGSMDIYVGEDENEKQHLAAFERDGIHYFVMSYNMNKKEFENILKKF